MVENIVLPTSVLAPKTWKTGRFFHNAAAYGEKPGDIFEHARKLMSLASGKSSQMDNHDCL